MLRIAVLAMALLFSAPVFADDMQTLNDLVKVLDAKISETNAKLSSLSTQSQTTQSVIEETTRYRDGLVLESTNAKIKIIENHISDLIGVIDGLTKQKTDLDSQLTQLKKSLPAPAPVKSSANISGAVVKNR